MKTFCLTAAALVMAAATPALAQDRYVFGNTHNEATPKATLLFDNITPFVSVDTGWIRENGLHGSANENYFTGIGAGFGHRSFFSFALGALAPVSPYTSATLTIRTGESLGTAPFRLGFYDVSAGLLELDADRNPGDTRGQELYADLGTGTNYGFGTIPGATSIGDTVTFTLNQAFLDRVNAGLVQDFSIGGVLFPAGGGGGAVPEPATWALMILGFGAVGGAMRRRPARVTAAA